MMEVSEILFISILQILILQLIFVYFFKNNLQETTGETEEGRQSDSGTDEDDKEETTGMYNGL